jgi:hypothetical protein
MARPRGWSLDAAQRPVFRYSLGGLDVEETLEPRLRKGGSILVRKLVVSHDGDASEAANLRLRHSGAALEFRKEGGRFVARAEWEVVP